MVAILGPFSANSFLSHFYVFGRETNKMELKMACEKSL